MSPVFSYADIRELDRRIGSRMDSVDRSLAELREEFSGFRSRMNAIVAIISAGALLVFGSAGMIWTGVSSLQRELGHNEATTVNLDKRFDELRGLGEKLNRVTEELARLQGRLDRDPSSPGKTGK
jgi:hypothetical protein